MVLMPSAMMPLGTAAADFQLPDAVSGRVFSLADIRGTHATLIMFICNHCPYVKHIEAGLAQFGKDYTGRGVGIAAINANDTVNYPDDSPDKMKAVAGRVGYTFPYLFDETQATARAYDAVCTPDFFLFDAELKCAYRGQFDQSRPGSTAAVTGKDLRQAADHLIAGTPVPPNNQTPSVGCSIKWKP